MILLWGMETDPPLRAVQRALDRIDISYFLLDQQHVLDTDVTLECDRHISGHVQCGGHELRLEDMTACYLRPDDCRHLPELRATAEDSAVRLHAASVEDTLLSWSEMTTALVINRIAAMGSNSSKPYQAELIHSLGFRTPQTLVTTDPAAALAFRDEHERVIYKSVSGVRSRISQLTQAHLERLPQVAACPTQFQEYVPGIDYRVHVVEEDTFACAVESESDDYRYGPSRITPCSIPEPLPRRCVALAEALGLRVAGIDLRQTPDGDWYCFEVNPSPGFTFYDRLEGEPIATRIAHALAIDG